MMPVVIDLPAQLKERGEFTDDDDLVFGCEGDHESHYRLRRRYYEAIDRAGLHRIRFHDLRHVFGSAAITTLDAYKVQSYMGHQHYSTTQRYLHHKPMREDAARIEDAFGWASIWQQAQRNSAQLRTRAHAWARLRRTQRYAGRSLQSRLHRFDSGRRLRLERPVRFRHGS